MALYTRKDLCDRLGISQAHISMAVKRGHLVVKKGMIDDSDPTNALYINKKLDGAGLTTAAPAAASSVKLPSDDPMPKRGSTEQYNLNLVKTKVAIKKTNEEYELVKLKKERLMGNSLPVEAVRTIVIIQAESARVAWENATEDLIDQLITKLQLSREQGAQLKKGITPIVNKAIMAAADTAKKEIRKLAIENSETKAQGEHG